MCFFLYCVTTLSLARLDVIKWMDDKQTENDLEGSSHGILMITAVLMIYELGIFRYKSGTLCYTDLLSVKTNEMT